MLCLLHSRPDDGWARFRGSSQRQIDARAREWVSVFEEENDYFMFIMSHWEINNITLIKENVP